MVWQEKNIVEISNFFTDGNWIGSKDQSEDGVRLIQTGNIGNGFFKDRGEKARYISEKTFKRLACVEIFPGDILISRLPDPVGRACVIPNTEERMITAVDCSILRLNSKIILESFFRYYVQSDKYFTDIEKETTGTTRKRISRKNLGKVVIPSPPLSEQKLIVKKLDEIFVGLAEAKKIAEKNLKNSGELFWSYLQTVFSEPGKNWSRKTLKGISLEFGRGRSRHRPRNDKRLYGGEYPFIQTGDIRNSNHLISKYSQTYNEAGFAQSKLWPKGTICITIAANIAETGVLGFDACFPDSVIGIVVNPKEADSDFIEYLLQFFKKEIQSKGKGSAQANINMATFEHEKFPIPPLAEQRSIVKKLNTLSIETKKLESINEKKLADLEELKKSVLGRAFSGKL